MFWEKVSLLPLPGPFHEDLPLKLLGLRFLPSFSLRAANLKIPFRETCLEFHFNGICE